MGKWILLFLALPALDLYLLVQLAHTIGGQNALLLALVSAAAGVLLARALGLRQFGEWQKSLARSQAPSQNVVEALLMLLACAWLVVPGIVSDALALLLLIPPLRRWLAERATARFLAAIERGVLRVQVQASGPTSTRAQPIRDVIDVEGELVEPEAPSGESRKLLTP